MPNFSLRITTAVGLAAAGLLVGCSDEPSGNEDDFDREQAAASAPDAGGHGSSDDGDGHGGSNGLPCDVAEALESHCATCHGDKPSFGAPMSLVSAADFQKSALAGGKMAQVVKARINETDPRRRMPPASSPQFTAAQLKALNAWLDKGAPASTASCGGSGHPKPTDPEPIDRSGLECYKLTAHNGDGKSKYKVGAAKDAYFNFTFKAPWTGMAYGIIFNPVIDNSDVIHHWLLFQDNANNKPTGAVPSIGAHPGGTLLNGWAPGGEPTNLRKNTNGEEVGIELPGDKSYTVEFHYNSNDANAVDASGVEICVQKKKPKNIAGLSWLGLDQLIFPSKTWRGTCRPKAPQQKITILGVTPHMHKQGTHMKGVINRKDGTKEVLHDAPFDFNYQVQYNKNVVINPGDTITTECTYAKPMAFGESTNAEMCYLFTLAYPKNALSDNGIWGAIAHGSGSCLGQ